MVGALLLLRPSAGGAHCGSSFNCNLLGFLIIPPLGLLSARLATGNTSVQLVFLGLALMVSLAGMIKNAPFLSREKPRAENRRKQLKTRALMLAVLVFTAALWLVCLGHSAWSTGLAAGLLFQGFMLLPPGISLVQKFDNFVNILAGRLGSESR